MDANLIINIAAGLAVIDVAVGEFVPYSYLI